MTSRVRFTWFAGASLIAACCLFVISTAAAEVHSPLSPADAQSLFQLADPALRIELVAAEPDVVDPVAIRFDEDGRMWVVEMRDYPLGPGGGPPLSRIRVLEDRDGDGRYETATTFAEKLLFPTGLQPWKGGVFVTLSGAVVYMKDTDSDGKCDLEETWFEGFAEQNSQLRANHPRLALDNWIYVANGLRGGKVVNRKLKDQGPIDISGMDFRFDPLTGQAEAVSGNGQFGLCFDDWGNRFTCSNRNPCRHVVIEDRYLKASPGVTVPAVMHDVAAFAENSRIYPISRAWTTSNLHAGQFTAACGVYIYRGNLLPAEFRGNVFTCDPTGNLVHREIMQPAGPTFTSRPAYEGKEFLASPDEWFRPVNMELGPDGALYVVDMYRCVIEHPDFVPSELKNRPDQRLGDDRGRIWRIALPLPLGEGRGEGAAGAGRREVAKADSSTSKSPELEKTATRRPLSKAPTSELVVLLEHPNAWQRDTAQRLLVERQDKSVDKSLRGILATSADAHARAQSLRVLQGLNIANPVDYLLALKDKDPQVRRLGISTAETTMAISEIDLEIRNLVSDDDIAVRFQARLATLISPKGPAWPGFYPVSDTLDPWMCIAFRLLARPEGLSLDRALGDWLTTRVTQDRDFTTAELELIEKVAEVAVPIANVRERQSAVTSIMSWLSHPKRPEAGIYLTLGVLRALAKHRLNVDDENLLMKPARRTELLVGHIKDVKLDVRHRQAALVALALTPNGPESIADLVASSDQTIRVAAIVAFSRIAGTHHWQPLLDRFASDTPAARRAILDGLLSNAERTKLLLDAIEAGKLKPSELDASHVKRLSENRNPEIKARAAKIIAAATPADRAKALADYEPVLGMPSDAKRGQAIFEKNCAACHKIGDVGVNVAPDISDSRTKTAAQLLGDILQPNRAIDNNYVGYSVRLLDGTVATGILTTETATSITLRQQGGKELVISRSEIDELRSSGVSLMPEGLERQVPPQDMADLLSFIKNWRYLDGRTPLAPPK